jgi:glycosyltransferase involved in cell wall biosynthesis
LVAEKEFSLVHLDSLDLSAFLEDLPQVPWVCAHHNVESELLRRRSLAERGARRSYMKFQADLLEHQEREWCPRFSLNLVVSKEDREVFRRLAPDADFLVVPNGVDTSAFRPSDSGTKNGSLVFVGGQAWFPNDDGMGYFANEILPLIRRTHPDIRTVWVGRASDKVKQEYAELGVEMTGYVEDIRPYVDPAACYIVPLRVGGGTRLKILDAWALGKAVVSTSRGCEGLDTRFGENILVADEPATFAAEVIRVLESADLRRRLGEGGRETAETTYDWEVIGESMLSAYRRILNPPPGVV